MKTNKQTNDQLTALKELKELMRGVKDKRVYAKVLHVSASGMSREITFRIIKNNTLYNITGLIKRITGYSWGKNWDGLRVYGCGMDMIFNTLYIVNSWAIQYRVIKTSKNNDRHELQYNGLVNSDYWGL